MSENLSQIVDSYISATNAHNPGVATGRGFHEHDSNLGDRSRQSIEERMRQVRGFLDRLAPADRGSDDANDAALLERRLRWELTENEVVRSWQRSPGAYLGPIGGACNSLVIRDFGPLDDRLRSLLSRLRQVPRFLEYGRANLSDPHRLSVETAIEQGTGLRMLFERDLPEAASRSSDSGLKADLEAANREALAAVDAFVAWLKTDVLPKANEEFAWGPDTFRDLLRYTDSVEDSLQALIERGEEDLRAHQQLLRDVAARIDDKASPAEVVDAVSRDHPPADRLLTDTEALLEDLRQFSIDAGLCTMPTEVRIRVKETPGFSRMTTQAACSPPGAFEKVATEAYYYVTPPDPGWSPERTEAYLKFFNRWSIPGVTAHEAYPGHYVHLTYLKRAKSRLGQYLMTTTTVEGWAHYIEQVMIEAGYGDGDPRLHLMQIREALLRLCRYRAAFGMHAEGWSVQQGIDFFINEGFATPVIAERETRRGVLGPNYYAYTMGKHQILALRDALRAKQGTDFNLTRFHDAFMQMPYPVATISRSMAGA
jgi:uncharacterized protein (DUF885 family)